MTDTDKSSGGEGPVGIKRNVKWRIKIDGKEYRSVDEMPAAGRDAYEEAVGPLANPGHARGEEFAKAPPRPRIGGFGGFSRRPRPIAPESFSARKLVVGAAIAALLAGLYFLARR